MAWKVGELARPTGLTVRTLHHYERIGLLTPSGRTGGGHRLYDEADVTRLYRVVALRELGLSLDAVGTALAGELDLADLLRSHLEHVGQQLTALRALHARLSTLVSAASRSSASTAARRSTDRLRHPCPGGRCGLTPLPDRPHT
ncbi:MerR family transcriptional regulator [Streptomyces sp. RKND-216]|uniref:MerR family transcriptional regulator n=1 Tax=Streptomyces sp. RKND-216 TaxID=2562581 RepID=UPI00109DFFF5|nr:MerR family transcriptional regulator [Streptomyces sp. RKND-216]THA24520.1 MerR family transcriptional regulator [Streptomyces sp. RKND-216]